MDRVSIIIPHFNDLANLRICLQSLAQQDYDRGSVEIIVADNNSACGLPAVQEIAGEDVRVILAAEQGAGPARNAGAGIATGSIFAFIDSDCVPAPDWVSRGVAALRQADFIGGRVDVLSQNPGRLTAVEAFESIFAFDFESYVTKKKFTGSGNMFVHRHVFEAVGGFRKTVSEDMEWSHRAIGKGFRLAYAPDVIIGHPARRTFAELVAKWRRLTAESYAYGKARGEARLAWIARTFAVLVSPAVHIFSALRSRKVASFTDRLKAAAVLVAIRFYRVYAMISILLRDMAGGTPDRHAKRNGTA